MRRANTPKVEYFSPNSNNNKKHEFRQNIMGGFTQPSMEFEGVIFRRPSGYFQLIIGLLCTSIIQYNGAVDLGKCYLFTIKAHFRLFYEMANTFIARIHC